MFSKPEPEMVHPGLYGELIDKGTDIIIEELKKYSVERRKLYEKIKGSLRIKDVSGDPERLRGLLVVSSDAGNNGVDFRSAFIPLYAAVAIAVRGWRIIDDPIYLAGKPEVWPNEFKASERESLLAEKLQYEVTFKAVKEWSPKLVILDGSLILSRSVTPTSDSSSEFRRDFKECVASAVKLLYECWRRGVALVGFVKRVRSSLLCEEYGFPRLRDTAILDLALRRGQYTLPTNPLQGLVTEEYKRYAIENLKLKPSEGNEVASVYSCYIRTGYQTPYRLELPKYALKNLEEIAGYLHLASEEDGIPFPIYEVDKLTKITSTISNVRSLMLFSKAVDLVRKGELKPEDLNLFALQHGEPWVLRETQYIKDLEGFEGE